MIGLDELAQTEYAGKLLRSLRKRLEKSSQTKTLCKQLLENFENEDYRGTINVVRQLLGLCTRSFSKRGFAYFKMLRWEVSHLISMLSYPFLLLNQLF